MRDDEREWSNVGMTEPRYVRLSRDALDAIGTAARGVTDDRLRRLLDDVVTEYHASTVNCLHARFLRAGSGRRCADCGSWV